MSRSIIVNRRYIKCSVSSEGGQRYSSAYKSACVLFYDYFHKLQSIVVALFA